MQQEPEAAPKAAAEASKPAREAREARIPRAARPKAARRPSPSPEPERRPPKPSSRRRRGSGAAGENSGGKPQGNRVQDIGLPYPTEASTGEQPVANCVATHVRAAIESAAVLLCVLLQGPKTMNN